MLSLGCRFSSVTPDRTELNYTITVSRKNPDVLKTIKMTEQCEVNLKTEF